MIFMTHLFRFEDLFHGLCSSLSVWICTLIRSCDDIYTSTVYTQGCQPHCKETLPRRTKEPYPYSIMSLISQSKLLTLGDPWWPWCPLRLFYSNAYLTRLEELTRENSLSFTFPQTGGRALRTWSICLATGEMINIFQHVSTCINPS